MATRAALLLAAFLAALPLRAAETRAVSLPEALPRALAAVQEALAPALVAPVGEFLTGVIKTPAELDAALSAAALKAADSPTLEPAPLDYVKSSITYPRFLSWAESGARAPESVAGRLAEADLVLSQWLPAAERAPFTEAQVAAARALSPESRRLLAQSMADTARALGLGSAGGYLPDGDPSPDALAGRFMNSAGDLAPLRAGELQRLFGVKLSPGLVLSPAAERSLRERSASIRAEYRKIFGRREERKLGLFQREVAEARQADLYLKKVDARVGFGVFAGGEIPRGEMVGEYGGVLLPDSPQLERYLRDNLYLFAYPSSFTLMTDARRWGSLTRFINHSARNANLVPEFVFHGGLFRLVFVASRTIARDAQLLFDYGEFYAAKKGLGSL